ALPSDTGNQRVLDKGYCKYITLQSGKTLEHKVVELKDGPVDKEAIQSSVENPIL
ncbi:hypothetical protein J1N35_043772, partial [Gossypium stocksii]